MCVGNGGWISPCIRWVIQSPTMSIIYKASGFLSKLVDGLHNAFNTQHSTALTMVIGAPLHRAVGLIVPQAGMRPFWAPDVWLLALRLLCSMVQCFGTLLCPLWRASTTMVVNLTQEVCKAQVCPWLLRFLHFYSHSHLCTGSSKHHGNERMSSPECAAAECLLPAPMSTAISHWPSE